jgi:hypothetical protein
MEERILDIVLLMDQYSNGLFRKISNAQAILVWSVAMDEAWERVVQQNSPVQ